MDFYSLPGLFTSRPSFHRQESGAEEIASGPTSIPGKCNGHGLHHLLVFAAAEVGLSLGIGVSDDGINIWLFAHFLFFLEK